MTISNIFYYKMIFAAEILIAEFLFTMRLKRRKLYWLRLFGFCALVLGFAALFPVPFSNAWYSSFVFFAIFAVTVPVLKACYNEPWINLLFCAIASYTAQHFAFELANLILTLVAWGNSPLFGMYASDTVTLFEWNKVSGFYSAIYLACYLASYVLIYYLFCKRIHKDSDMRIRSLWLMLLIGAGLLCNILLHAVIIYKPFDRDNILVNCAYNIMSCILLLCGQFGLLQNKGLKTELDVVQQLWHDKQDQYKILKENMDIINMKYHDMRHQIREINDKKHISDDVIAEIQDSIRLYDSAVKTGNEALDVILTDKSLRANANGVIISCVADGNALEFLSEADIYSLFGNALDNALDAVMKIPDPERRLISINVRKVAEFVSVCIKNSYTGTVKFGDDGLPVTTKDNALYHGYGVKSINYIADKYDGSLSVSADGETFMLSVLFPNKTGE